MTDEHTTSIPTLGDAIHEPLRRLAKLSKRFNLAGRWLVATVPAAGILVYSLARPDTPEPLRNATIAIGVGAGLLGAGLWIAGILLRSHMSHFRASRFDVEQQRLQLVAECERFVAGLDTTMLAGLVTQIQGIEALLPALRAAHELSTGQILMLLADVDRRWQADLTRVSDVGVKLIGESHDRLDKLAELIPLAIDQAARKAAAAAVQDLRAEFAAEREAMAITVEQVARNAYAAGVRDVLAKLTAEREAAAREMEETIKRVFAQGYVSGVRERVNGEGGKVVQLPLAEA